MMRPAAPRIMPEKAAGAQRGALVVADILAFLRCGCNLLGVDLLRSHKLLQLTGITLTMGVVKSVQLGN